MKTLITALAAAAAFTAVPAVAAPLTIHVDYSDLDLNSTADQNTLERRVEIAVRNVCPRPGPYYTGAMAQWKECLEKTRAKAMAQVAEVTPTNAPALASRL